jgi:hypothetical protein
MDKPSWKNRRRFLILVNLFCAAVISYILYTGMDNGPADTAMTMAFTTIAISLSGYVLGAAYEDVQIHRAAFANGMVNPYATGAFPAVGGSGTYDVVRRRGTGTMDSELAPGSGLSGDTA